IYIILGLSLNVIVGYAGMFQLGHAAFYGIGAYTAAILNIHFGIPILWLIPVSAVMAGLFAFVLTRPIIHLRGDYLCIVTIAFGEIVRIALKNDIFGITGGPNGLSGISRPEILGFTIKTPLQYYYLIWIFVVLSIFVIQRLENSRLGRAWNYVREDELAAEAMGVDTVKVKVAAFVIGSAWAGIAGLLYASRYRVIAPENFSFLESVIMFCIVVLGGTGSITGVFVGTFGMVVLPEIFRPLKDWRDAWLGVAMVVMMILRPAGLWPSRRLKLEIEDSADSALDEPAL
ncbi:MAG TPA: branched-chain amino acid ABC transporter permease, partial [Propionibacteriaceae bacterium]|nr:branched-chain amino acid ABC transporter permease [Propionibacteriaceae bacterium]